MRCVKDTLPPRPRARWLLMTMRLSASSLAGIARTLVAVGTARLADMLATVRAAAPRRRTCSPAGAGAGAGAWGAWGASGVSRGAAGAAGVGGAAGAGGAAWGAAPLDPAGGLAAGAGGAAGARGAGGA